MVAAIAVEVEEVEVEDEEVEEEQTMVAEGDLAVVEVVEGQQCLEEPNTVPLLSPHPDQYHQLMYLGRSYRDH